MKKTALYLFIVLFASLFALISGCGGDDSPALSVSISGITSAEAGEDIRLTVNTDYTGTGTLSYAWYLGTTQLNNNKATLTVRIDNPAGPLPLKVIVSDGIVQAEASTFVTWY